MRGWKGYSMEVDVGSVDVDVDVNDIIGVLRELSKEDLDRVKEEFPEILQDSYDNSLDFGIDITKIPNIIAEKEYKDFIEAFRKKYFI